MRTFQNLFKLRAVPNSQLYDIISKAIFLSLILFVIGCNTNSSNTINYNPDYKPIINKLSNQGNWEEAIDIANIQLQQPQLELETKIYTYLVLGENYRFLEEYELAASNFRKVIDLARASDEFSEYLGEAYYGLGDLNYLNWNYFKQEAALENSKMYLDSSMVYAKEGNHLALESKILYRLGTIFQIQEDREKSMESFEKGLEISYSIADTVGIIRNEIHKAAEFESAGMLDSALFHYTRAYEFGRKLNRNYSEAHSLCNLGSYYFDLGEIAIAKSYYEQAKFLSEELNHHIVLCRSYYGLSKVEMSLGNTEKAQELIDAGLTFALEKGYKNYEQIFRNLKERLNSND